jgi:hypothetical protein
LTFVRDESEDKPATICEIANRGVSQLIQGKKTARMLYCNKRTAKRRRNRQLAAQRRAAEAQTCRDAEEPSGGNGHAAERGDLLPALPVVR